MLRSAVKATLRGMNISGKLSARIALEIMQAWLALANGFMRTQQRFLSGADPPKVLWKFFHLLDRLQNW